MIWLSVIVVILLAAFIFCCWMIEDRYFPLPGFKGWWSEGINDITRKTNVMWAVMFVFALIITTAAPYARKDWPGGFREYLAFAAPSAAGIVAGAGLFFDGHSKFDISGKAYLVAVALILLGWVCFVLAAKFSASIFLWAMIITIASVTAALIGISIKKTYVNQTIEPLLMPLVIMTGIASIVLGLLGFFYLI